MHLALYWEVNGDPITDDYSPEDIAADELWRKWRDRYVPDDGWTNVLWYVKGTSPDGQDGVFAAAPGFPFGIDFPAGTETWSEAFSWPVHADTSERLNFLTLPVLDKLWRPSQTDKGGFIQEYLGWKPAALQSRIHVPTLEIARGSR